VDEAVAAAGACDEVLAAGASLSEAAVLSSSVSTESNIQEQFVRLTSLALLRPSTRYNLSATLTRLVALIICVGPCV
jgi:hypothetical protein